MATNKRKAPEPVGGSILLRTATASCEIGLFGGHILSWKVQGEEQMFMSSKAIMDGGESVNTAIRGGFTTPQVSLTSSVTRTAPPAVAFAY